MERKVAVDIVSGGMDSVTLAHLIVSKGHDLSILAFDYGQRHKKELDYAERCAGSLGANFEGVDLSGVGRLLCCYEGGEAHRGLCGTCNEREEAFELAGVPDPTIYSDRQAARK